ncbi:MAG TPA: GNAT family N-acetyltransferase [Bacteroidetes bacterium]|nr:GNAT family N-acetyltransferase [Bacteroidota bacterium]
MQTSTITKAIETNNLLLEVDAHDQKILQQQAPFICIANQSLEYIDEIVLMKLMEQNKVPFKIIGRPKKFPEELSLHFLPVELNLMQWEGYTNTIFKQLKYAKEAGLVACLVLHFSDKSIDTLVRNRLLNHLMKAVLKARMPIVPIRIRAPFPDFIRPRIGKMMILKKRKEPYRVTIRIGKAIPPEEQQKIGKAKDFKRYLQSKIFSLGSGLQLRPLFFKNPFARSGKPAPIAPPTAPELIVSEINAIRDKALIAAHGDYDILVVRATQIPQALKEIGRLRELTFRSVGEGTGKPLDLDEYDLYYRQLILWDRKAGRIAGGYRMGPGDEIFQRYGAAGFYISSVFKIKKGFYPTMKKAVELGRSYIVPAYQKKRMPLFLLWKGILYFLLKNPQYHYLYGPVSISKFYSEMSRSLIVAFIKNYYFNHRLARYLTPRKPFKAKVDKVDIEMLAAALGDKIKNLDSLIEDIEPDHIRIPVLVRQYLKLNARFISFNLDPNFSDVLDGFIILNLDDVPQTMIEALKRQS